MAGRIAGITIEIGGDTSKLTAALKKVDQPLRKTKTGLKDIERLLKFNPGNTTLLEQKQRNLASAITKTKERLDVLREAEAQMAGRDLTEDEQRQFEALQREIIATENQLKQLEKQMADFGSVGAQKIAAAGKKMEAFGDKLQAAGAKITSAGKALMPLTGAIVGVGAAAYKAWKEVDDGGDAIARMTGATGEALAEMQALSNEIATEIPTSFETAGNAIGEVATRFDLQGAALKSLSSAYVKFADVNNSDVTSAIDSTQKAMAAWNIEAEDAGLYLDALTAASQKTGVKIETISAQAATNAAALKEVGFGASDAALFLGMLEKNGVDASGAMAGLKKAYANALKDGMSLKDQLMELEAGLQNEETRADAAAAAIELFGTRAGGALTEALSSGRISFAELGTDLQDFAGTVENTFNATLDPIDKVQTTLNELKLAGADLFNAAGPLITEVLDKATAGAQKLSKWLGTLSDDEKRQVIRMAGIAAAAGPVLMVVGKLTSGAGKVISAGGKILQLAPKISGAAKTVTKGVAGMNGSVLSSVAGFASAHPVILAVVAGITALTVAAIAAKKGLDTWAEANYGLTTAQKKLHEEIKESSAAYAEAEQTRRTTISGINEEYGYYQKLARELDSITDADGRVLAGKEARAEFITGTLSDALGIEISMVDGVIQKNGELMASIDAVIEKKRAEAMLNADQSAYEEAIKGSSAAQQKYAEAINSRTQAQQQLTKAQNDYNAAVEKYEASNYNPASWLFDMVPAEAALKAATQGVRESETAVRNAETEWRTMQATISNHEALAEAAISGEGLAEAMYNVSNGFLTAETASADMLKNQAVQFAQKYAEMAAAAQSGMAGVTQEELIALQTGAQAAIAEAQKAGVDTGAAINSALIGQSPEVRSAAAQLVDASAPTGNTAGQWTTSTDQIIASVLGGFNTGVPLVQQGSAALMAATAPPAADTSGWSTAGAANPQAYAAGMQGGAGAVQSSAAAVEKAATPPAGNTAAWGAAGAANPQAYAAGMQGGAGAAQGAGAKVSQAGVTGAKSAAPQMQAAGQSLGQTNAAGITATSALNSAAGLNIANAARSSAGTVSLYSTGYSTGSSYGTGLVAGLQSQLASVRAAASALTAAAGSAGNAALEINSPSHVAQRTGQGYGEGLILGMHDMQRDVSRAATRLAGMVAAGAPTAMIDYPNQQAEIAARSITVTAQAAPTDGGVSQMLGAILTRLNNLDVVIRNAGQFADGVTNYANRRLGRISTLQESGVI